MSTGRTVSGFVIVHRKGEVYLGREGQLREFPLLFRDEKDAEMQREKAQIPDDWHTSLVHLSSDRNSTVNW